MLRFGLLRHPRTRNRVVGREKGEGDGMTESGWVV
jgi:hypothetical protein